MEKQQIPMAHCVKLYLSLLVLLFTMCERSESANVTYDPIALKINGERQLILSGAIHYPRSTVDVWSDLMKLSVDAGLNTIETYVFWHQHEPTRGEFHFEDNLDLVCGVCVCMCLSLDIRESNDLYSLKINIVLFKCLIPSVSLSLCFESLRLNK
jgi:hypothetical protein